ncbi:MAG: DegT/DnrJ/EryC1/StrS family aminotransferase [Candidatus Lokiarchaeia archaeon]
MKDIQPFNKPIYIVRPLLPPIKLVYKKIKEIWKSKWLTNMGSQHQALESELLKYLDVPFLSLFCNGTLALQLAFQALKLKGEVITTPFTFPATVNALYQNNLKPIYCDIKFDDFNLNPEMIEELITSKTSAILPVHVFGNPCNMEQISKIAEDCNLKVVYDAAHCFGVKYKNKGIGNYGDISMFSFHATKIFNTLEGGALSFNNSDLKQQLYLLKNFGIKNEEEVILPGTNAKLNELQAAIGLLSLQLVDEEIEKRKKLTFTYKENLKNIEGIKYSNERKNVKYNYQYFSILIDETEFKYNRDQVYEYLKKYNIFSRRYFYPLCTEYKFVKNDDKIQIPNAKKIVKQILCLPLYGELTQDEINTICEILLNI